MYYVIYENESERRVSFEKHTPQDVKDYIDNAKELDKRRNLSYHYTVVQEVNLAELLKK